MDRDRPPHPKKIYLFTTSIRSLCKWIQAEDSETARRFPIYFFALLCLVLWFCFSYEIRKNKKKNGFCLNIHLDKKQKH